MENFLISLNVVLPLLLFMTVGILLRKIKLLNDGSASTVNSICFKVFLPILLFKNISQTDISQTFDWKLMVFCAVATVLIFVLAWAFIPFVEKDNKKRGVMIQGIFRSNFVLFGVPVIEVLFGGEDTGAAALAMAVTIPLYNALSVVILEVYKGDKIKPLKIVKGVLLNPLIIASLLGIIFIFIPYDFYSLKFFDTTVSGLAAVATPLSFVALGATFSMRSARTHIKQLSITVPIKLLLVPIAVTGIAVAMGFRDTALATILTMAAAPTAISAFPMAEAAGADKDLAGEIVVFTAGFSIITVFCFILTFKSLGLM